MSIVKRVLAGQVDGVRQELGDGADVNQRDKEGRTALMHAVLVKSLPIVSLLLDAGGDPNIQDEAGYSALHFAAQDYLPEIAGSLLSHGAVVDLEDKHGNTPLARAVFSSRGRGDIIQILLRAGASRDHLNRHGVSPAALAKSIVNYDVARFLA